MNSNAKRPRRGPSGGRAISRGILKTGTLLKFVLGGAMIWYGQAGISAAGIALDQAVVTSGGGTSTGAVFSISGTAGQLSAGVAAGGSYGVVGGFWGMVAVVSTPLLTLVQTATNTLLVCWPSVATCFALEQNDDLGSTNWVATGLTPADNGTVKSVVVQPRLGMRYFRLKQQ